MKSDRLGLSGSLSSWRTQALVSNTCRALLTLPENHMAGKVLSLLPEVTDKSLALLEALRCPHLQNRGLHGMCCWKEVPGEW